MNSNHVTSCLSWPICHVSQTCEQEMSLSGLRCQQRTQNTLTSARQRETQLSGSHLKHLWGNLGCSNDDIMTRIIFAMWSAHNEDRVVTKAGGKLGLMEGSGQWRQKIGTLWSGDWGNWAEEPHSIIWPVMAPQSPGIVRDLQTNSLYRSTWSSIRVTTKRQNPQSKTNAYNIYSWF